MTQNEFAIECAKRLVDPALAIECDEVRAALKSRDDVAVIEALEELF